MRAPAIKGRLINWGCVGPMLATLALAGGIVAGAIYLAHHSHRAPEPSARLAVQPHDELRRELAHCQLLGSKAGDDPDCIAAWMENRRRFFNGNGSASANSERQSQP